MIKHFIIFQYSVMYNLTMYNACIWLCFQTFGVDVRILSYSELRDTTVILCPWVLSNVYDMWVINCIGKLYRCMVNIVRAGSSYLSRDIIGVHVVMFYRFVNSITHVCVMHVAFVWRRFFWLVYFFLIKNIAKRECACVSHTQSCVKSFLEIKPVYNTILYFNITVNILGSDSNVY